MIGCVGLLYSDWFSDPMDPGCRKIAGNVTTGNFHVAGSSDRRLEQANLKRMDQEGIDPSQFPDYPALMKNGKIIRAILVRTDFRQWPE